MSEQHENAVSKEKETKTYDYAEIGKHKDEKSCWMVIHNKVYDITEFIVEHPGGEEILMELAGEDATESFEDVGHSTDARDILNDYYIGELDEKSRTDKPAASSSEQGGCTIS